MRSDMVRRDFLATLGVSLSGAALGVGLGELPVAGPAAAQEPARGRIPDTPVKFGHITILSGPGALLGAPSLKGHTLAAEEITGLYLFKTAVERASRQAGGGWPDDEAISRQLEGLSIAAPAGLVTIRKEDHRADKDVKVGFSKNLPDYPFPVWDPERILTISVASMTAPPTWPKPGKGHNDPSATVNWIKTTWRKAGA
jgi:hypothetical protein